jgi:hypothetical protein
MIKFIEDKELCIKLKEKCFDEGCILNFRGMDIEPISQMDYELKYRKNSEIGDESNYWLTCPTYCQVTDWFREKHNICVSSDGILNKTVKPYAIWFIPTVTTMDEGYDSPFDVDSITDNYYGALNEAINEALKLI